LEDEGESGPAEEDDVEEDVIIRPKTNGISAEEEEEFARELAKMTASSTDKSKTPHKQGLMDVSLPVIKRKPAEEEEAGDDQHMRFTLLTKRGAKAQASCHNFPFCEILTVG
jgi:hypothetical protein